MIQTSHQVLDLRLGALVREKKITPAEADTLRVIMNADWRKTLKISNGSPDHPAWEVPEIAMWQSEISRRRRCHRVTIWRHSKRLKLAGLIETKPGRVVMKSADECRRESGNRYSLEGEGLDIWRAMVAAFRRCADPQVRAAAARETAALARENGLESGGFRWPGQVFDAIARGAGRVSDALFGDCTPPAAAVETSMISKDVTRPRPSGPAPLPARGATPLLQALEAAAAGDTFAAGLLAALTGRKKDDPPDKI